MPPPERGTPAAGGRRKVEPDPQIEAAIITAATDVVRREGVSALSIAQVLAATNLGTRAFYRHFDSKDQLIAAVFLEMARGEVARLQRRIAQCDDPVRATLAWIDGRLDVAFDRRIRSDLRQMSLEAQNQMFASPQLVAPAYREILRPLVEQLTRGRDLGIFLDINPDVEALSIHGVVWASVERHWAAASRDPDEVRGRVQRFCLGGLGLTPETISAVLVDERNRRGRASNR